MGEQQDFLNAQKTRKGCRTIIFLLVVVIGGVVFFTLNQFKYSGILRSGKTSDATSLYQLYPINQNNQFYFVSVEGVYKTTQFEKKGGITTRSGSIDIRMSIYDLAAGELINKNVIGKYPETEIKILGFYKGNLWVYNSREGIQSLTIPELKVQKTQEELMAANTQLAPGFAMANSSFSNVDELYAYLKKDDNISKLGFFEHAQGRMTLQKRIMALLRNIEHCVNGVQPAWEETFRYDKLTKKKIKTLSNLIIHWPFRNWEASSKILQTYPKCKTEDGQAEIFHRGMGKRRASHQSSEHDLEEQIIEWANMTWFLLAMGGVCLQRPRNHRQLLQSQNNSSLGSLAQNSLYSLSSSASSGRGSLHPSTISLVSSIGASSIGPVPPQDVQYCPVTQ